MGSLSAQAQQPPPFRSGTHLIRFDATVIDRSSHAVTADRGPGERDLPARHAREMLRDGRFHEIKVRVKRGSYEVRARAGYWAPKPGDVQNAQAMAAAAVLPEPIGAAFAALTPPNSSRVVETWIDVKPLSKARSQIMIA